MIREMNALQSELRAAEARAAEAEEQRLALAAEVAGMESRLKAAVAVAEKESKAVGTQTETGAVAAAAAAVVEVKGEGTGCVEGDLRRLQAELRATKARLDTSRTNQALLQRYIAVRRLNGGGVGPMLVGEEEGGGAGCKDASGGMELPAAASCLMPTN